MKWCLNFLFENVVLRVCEFKKKFILFIVEVNFGIYQLAVGCKTVLATFK